MFLMTHAYFLFYHSLSDVVLRRLKRAAAARGWTPRARTAAHAAAVFALSYATAFMETLTIAHVRAD